MKESEHSFFLDNLDEEIKPVPPQIERMTRPFLVTYPEHDAKFYDRLKLADIYIQGRKEMGEEVTYLRDELTNIFVARNMKLLEAFIRKVLKIN